MIHMKETFDIIAKGKDLESFSLGYCIRQEHIDILQEENYSLKKDIKKYETKKNTIESLERLFGALLKHEHSECGACLYCENQWKIINLIKEKLEEMKSTNP